MLKAKKTIANRVQQIENEITSRTKEIERIKGVLVSVNAELDTVLAADTAIKRTITALQTERETLSGLEALGRLNADELSRFHGLDSAIAEAETQRAPKTQTTQALTAKYRAIATVLEQEQQAVKALAEELPEAIRAARLLEAEPLLIEFMALSQQLADNVTRLVALNDAVGCAIFYENTAFALPLPQLEPWASQAKDKPYHLDAFTRDGRLYGIHETVRGGSYANS